MNSEEEQDTSQSDSKSGGVGYGEGGEIIGLVNKLRSLGAHLELDLPTIVLCGQQSSGKSSLAEAICGVALPRASGTCTRCVTEVRLVRDKNINWRCKVFVRVEWDERKNMPMRSVKEVTVGETSKKQEVAIMVSHGQDKLLYGGKFQFTRNVVCVEITSKDCVNLTVVDLPGLIFATERDADRSNIDLVKNLVVSQVKKENTVIAAVVSTKEDMENQIINTLTRQYDPSGKRTIGILTKVDVIEEGCEKQWVDVMEGRRYPLKMGYVAVKNPSQSDLNRGITMQEARANERTFFLNKHPWNSLGMNARLNYGSEVLTTKLSKALGGLIAHQLPKMKSTVNMRIEQARKDLTMLPPAPMRGSSSKSTITDLILKMSDGIKTMIRSDSHDFWRDVMLQFRQYFHEIEQLKPHFSLTAEKSKSPGRNFTLQQVLQLNAKEQCRALTFAGSTRARKVIIESATKLWEPIMLKLVDQIHQDLSGHINKFVERGFLQYSRLHARMCQIVGMFLEQKHKETLTEVKKYLMRERASEFTLSVARLRQSYHQAYTQYKAAFSPALDKKKKKHAENDITLGGDENEVAYMVMAESLAYYDCCFRRFVDTTTMAIEHVLIRDMVADLEKFIFEKFDIWSSTSEKKLTELMMENPEIASRRAEIESSLDRLVKIQEELSVVCAGYSFQFSDRPTPKFTNVNSFSSRNPLENVHPRSISGQDEEKEKDTKKKKKGLFW